MRKDSLEIEVSTTTVGAEIISDTLTELTGEGVCVSDEKDVLDVLTASTNWDYVEDNLVKGSSAVTVKGFCRIEDSESVLTELKKRLEAFKSEDFGIDFGTLKVETQEVSTDNWDEEWRKFYKTIELDKIAVVPDWIDYDGGKAVVRLEPGMAFGTGEHASTRLCLGLLESLELVGLDVIDVGTGSGILGIAASKLGAKSVYMTDIDEKAVAVARENVEKNGAQNCTVEVSDLADSICQDVILANLTADILLRLLDRLSNSVKKGSKLIASGIIAERLDEVLEAYTGCGFKLIKVLSQDDWRAVMMEY